MVKFDVGQTRPKEVITRSAYILLDFLYAVIANCLYILWPDNSNITMTNLISLNFLELIFFILLSALDLVILLEKKFQAALQVRSILHMELESTVQNLNPIVNWPTAIVEV